MAGSEPVVPLSIFWRKYYILEVWFLGIEFLKTSCVCCETFSSTVTLPHDTAVVDPDGPGSLKCSGTFGTNNFEGWLDGRLEPIPEGPGTSLESMGVWWSFWGCSTSIWPILFSVGSFISFCFISDSIFLFWKCWENSLSFVGASPACSEGTDSASKASEFEVKISVKLRFGTVSTIGILENKFTHWVFANKHYSILAMPPDIPALRRLSFRGWYKGEERGKGRQQVGWTTSESVLDRASLVLPGFLLTAHGGELS